MALISILSIIAITALLFWALKIYRNYLIALKTNLPIIISPLTPNELPWHLSRALFGAYVSRQRWFRALDQTCAWQDKNTLHAQLGPCFMHVSPGYNMLCTNDALAIDHVFKNMRDFPKPEVFKRLDFFGPNVITVNGEGWVRHRKLTAPCFNERVSAFVWDESLRQAGEMLDTWIARPGSTSSDVVLDAGTVALHVLTAAAFGQQREFRDGVNRLEPGHEVSFRDALRTLLLNIITSAVVGPIAFLQSPAMQIVFSSRIKKVVVAFREFRGYMIEAIAREREAQKSSSRPSSTSTPTGRPNLLNALVQASDEVRAEDTTKAHAKPMSDDELTGNMFMFAFAGHETTATTISYALAVLSLNPDVQEWVAAELGEVMENAETLEYAKIQPRLKRTLAVMYETVRCFGVPPPWRDVERSPSISPPCIPLSNLDNPAGEPTILPIPPNTQVSLNVYACHSSPDYFPNDPTSWNPRRWIQPSSTKKLSDEQFLATNKAFFGWGGGPRVCPGMKFAQVEFTAVMATILTKWRVLPATKSGGFGGASDASVARQDLEQLIAESVASLAVTFKDPENLCIRLERR